MTVTSLRRLAPRRALASVALLSLALTSLPVGQSVAANSSGDSFWVVSMDRRITDGMRASVVRSGFDVVDYWPRNAYLVWGDADAASAADDLRRVKSVRRIAARDKIHPFLHPYLESPLTSVHEAPATLRVQATIAGEFVQDGVGDLNRLGRVHRVFQTRADGLTAGVQIDVLSSALLEFAAHPAVLYLSRASRGLYAEDERGTQIIAGNIDGDANEPVAGYAAWLEQIGLSGKGVIVAVVDTGISAYHPDLEGRTVANYNYADTPVEAMTDIDAHGTHVSGIIGGAPPPSTDFADPDGFVYGQGVAPEVQFVRQNILSTTGHGVPREYEGFEALTRDSWEGGARMWNSSWHTVEGTRAGYLESVRATDELARNAVLDKKGAEEFLFVYSAGNAGANGPTVPHEAKNIIAVGATRSGRGITYPLTGNIDEVSSFSSKGPTLDGRVFPVVSAPGENVISARAPEGVTAFPCTDPLVFQALYCSFSGTSMAAPHVTGSAALIHEWWKREFRQFPSPAMVKALLVNTATDIGSKDIPNNNEGWGRINIGELFAPRASLYVDQSEVFDGPKENRSYTVRVSNTDRPLKVTLAWSDAPGAVLPEGHPPGRPSSPALVNDLDLLVERLSADGSVLQSWRGNVFKVGRSFEGGKPDRLNNLENVFLLDPAAGTYRITISAFNVPGDGIPENPDETDQDYALVVRWAK